MSLKGQTARLLIGVLLLTLASFAFSTSGWAYGTMGILSGSASITSGTTNTGVGMVGNHVFSMDNNGIMTEAGDSSFHGVMSGDKTMIVATDTNGGHPEIWVMMKDTGGTFSTADMMGDWVMHSVSSGNPASRDWTFGHSVVDATGHNTFSEMMDHAGMILPTSETYVMNGGVMTIPGTGGGIDGDHMGGHMDGGMMGGGVLIQTFHGIMNDSKNLAVSTYSDGSGGYPFSIQVK